MANVKITALTNIGSNILYSALIPIVNMTGTPVTQQGNIQILGNYILSGAGSANFAPAYLSNLAYSVVNAAQPNITSVGTLTSLAVTGNITSSSYATANFFVGDGGLLTNVSSAGTSIANGTSNVSISAAGGNINISRGGTANVLVVSGTGVNIAGTLNTGTSNITANYYIGNGSLLTGITAGAATSIANGTSNVTIPASSGNVNTSVGGTSNVLVVSGTGVTVTGNTTTTNLNITGNVTSNLLPNANVTYNLGSSTQRWNDIWLANSTIYLGNSAISAGDSNSVVFSGSLQTDGNITANADSNITITTTFGNTAYEWIFGTDGTTTFPTGNLVITPVDVALGNSAVIASTDHNLITLSTGANGGVSSLWVEDYANIGTSNIAAVYANPIPGSGNVRIAVGQNGGGGPKLWNFTPTGVLTAPGNITFLGDASSAPWLNNFNVSAVNINATAGNLAVANGGAGGASGGYISATHDISATGNITGNYFIGNGSQLTDVGAASVPGQNILPTIQTITISATSNGGDGAGTGWANVTVANTIPVTEYGVIVTAGTISQKYVTSSLGSIPGTVQLNITTGLNTTPFTVYAYVTSNAGTYYSNSATGTSGICLLAGTQIALSDGTYKAIEDITYTDKMLSWDFDRGCYAETTALWIKRSETGSQYNLLTFSDGTTLRTFDQHRIFNKQAGAFTYPMTDATPIGTITVNEHGQEITLTNKQVIQDTIEYYNVITDYHMNLFSDSVLTSCRFNNIYPITDMKFVKDARTLRTRDEFENVEDRFFRGLRLAEQTIDLETIEWYVDRLLSTDISTQL